MDRLRQRLSVATQATATLRELALRTAPSKIERDAPIQRFESSFEAAWKTAQRFLETGLLSAVETERALAMTDDRSLTAHTYNERLAEAIFKRLPGHLDILVVWLAAMQSRLPTKP